MFNLGKRYESGDGVAKDYDKAREWFKKAAAKDNSDAMYNLGLLYRHGRGGAQDYGAQSGVDNRLGRAVPIQSRAGTELPCGLHHRTDVRLHRLFQPNRNFRWLRQSGR